MSDGSLTYRASGVDVEANLEANRRIQESARRTCTSAVLTGGGTFGGAYRLPWSASRLRGRFLSGRLFSNRKTTAEASCRAMALECRSSRTPETLPLVFLDYLAAARLDAGRAADLVEIFAGVFSEQPRIPIIGGETAEMPDVFASGAWEIVGALFSTAAGKSGAGDAPRSRSGRGPGGRIDLDALRDLEQPVLVFSMDGVGTKTKIGVAAGRIAGLARDIIHHCLDDILCQGARGIGFMLYLGCHSREEELTAPLVEEAAGCCAENGLILLDSLVCEKPDLYRPGEIDVCGAVVGAVDAADLIQGQRIRPGDLLLGLPSAGLHTNGYSLARRALLERGGMNLDQPVTKTGRSLGAVLLEPHRNYAPAVLPLLHEGDGGSAIRGIAHVTGGGLEDNLARILPPGTRAEICIDSWEPPPIFELIRSRGQIPLRDPVGKGMYESFNMGIGMVLVAAPDQAEAVHARVRDAGLEGFVIGQVLEAAAAGAPARRVRLI